MTNKLDKYLIIILCAIIIALLCITKCSFSELSKAKANIAALNDTVKTERLANNDLMASRNALILEKNGLENTVGLTKKQVKELEKRLGGDITYVTDTKMKTVIDSIVMKDTIGVRDGDTVKEFGYENDWFAISGWHDEHQTVIDTMTMEIEVNTGIADLGDNKYRTFVTTSNPYVELIDMNSAVIDGSKLTKKKKWGLYVGVGPYVGYGTDFTSFGPQFGIGVHFGFGYIIK